MLKIYQITRTLHTSKIWMSDTKSVLSSLRKKTGYPLTNCRKALEACDYDLSKAETWLKEQALALGWAKAFKLSDRSTLQGLIAVMADNKSVAMVEVNCETDFVAKNNVFQNLAFNVASACFSWTKNQNQLEDPVTKLHLDTTHLRNLSCPDGHKLEDEVAMVISQVGESIKLRRAACVKVTDELQVAACSHPIIAERDAVAMGKYGSVLVYKANNYENTTTVAKQLCQHIIGMNPAKIGEINEDNPKENRDNESCLIHQEFIMESEVPVSQILKENDIALIEFTRFECGEDLEEIIDNMPTPEPIQNVA